MKLNKNKIIVSALALGIAGSLVGSVGSTIAWYQYSTRANVSYIGQASGFSSNLQMRFAGENDDAWRTRITWQEMNTKLGNNMNIVPMTFGALDKDGGLPEDGYVQPAPGVGNMAKWTKATNRNYAQFKLELRNVDRNGDAVQDSIEDVYISKLLIQEDASNAANNKHDLSDAIRVHISTSHKEERIINEQPQLVDVVLKNKLISNKGETIATHGSLDIDGDNRPDRAYPENDEWGFSYTDDAYRIVTYGSGYQSSYVNDKDFTAGTKWEADELTAAATVAAAYGKTIDDWKVEPVVGVHWTQEELDAAQEGDPAYGKTLDDWKVEPVVGVHWTQAEIDLAEATHGKTVDDFKVDPKHPAVVGSDGNKLTKLDYDDDDDEQTPNLSKSIGKTTDGANGYLTVTVTIWVEGWQKFDNGATAIWDAVKYIDSKFNIGIQFAVQDRQ